MPLVVNQVEIHLERLDSFELGRVDCQAIRLAARRQALP
jgi:hypothetical protein